MEVSDSAFVPKRPNPEVSTYLDTHPDLNLGSDLSFLSSRFPPYNKDGSARWILEGGAAIHLLDPSRTPHDLDIVSFDIFMRPFFANTGRFDVKDWEEWASLRNLDDPETTKRFLTDHTRKVELQNGLTIPAADRELLLFSKETPYRGRSGRPEDLQDIQLLRALQEATL